MSDRQVVALVPARSGSKGVPNKNLAELGGFPLLAYSIGVGLLARTIDRVILSTDSEAIAEVGSAYGAEVPFLRPAEIATAGSLDIEYVRHALAWLADHEGETPSLVVQLRPTTPLRDPQLVDEAVEAVRGRSEATGLRSVHQLPEPPQKMVGIEDGWMTGLFPQERRPDYLNLPRQAFPPAYWPNGYVDVVRPAIVSEGETLYGARVLAKITPAAVEIDGPEELEYLRYQVERTSHPLVDVLRRTTDNG